MRNRWIIALALAAAAAPGMIRADIPPRPGDREAALLRIIEEAVHPCGQVGSFTAATGADADAMTGKGLDAFTVSCTNGKTYLVGLPRRRPGPPLLGPDGKPVPLPDPVVKEVSR